MQIVYRTKQIQKHCTDYSLTKKKYGRRMAGIIHQRIAELAAAESVQMLILYGIGRCHALAGERKGQYALDLIHPRRLVFTVPEPGLICIEEIADYH